ncbi:hypothetical protein [Piscibacillus halophilus]|uniref:Helix-turn-helix domain of resolvase n=1 Tax=Piscibacillus halophilus TaxID=571933 RepID=A0A1H9MC59_9BACI|nr:hypothetical protein [Piscibacillus halophilus]SER21264.1 hypothetical protein SAMN05216362_16010 [Piscibacillus halophilus]
MDIAILTLIIISIVLFILSFFMNNRFDELEKQIEDISIASMQNEYQLKNKIKVLEEELLVDPYDMTTPRSNVSQSVTEYKEPTIVQKVKNLYDEGYSLHEISNESGLREEDIRIIVNQREKNESFK